VKPSVPKGTRDFSPTEMVRRNFIFKTIREVFEKYGYQPIETPAMENLETLTGKYGEEGDRLIFKILDSGDFWGNVKDFYSKNKIEIIEQEAPQETPNLSKQERWEIIKSALNSFHSTEIVNKISEKALRYDLTVPFARYVVQHQNEIAFPFKRYQIQPVWRADRPQKGRYREFYQCDADVIGSDSLLNEVELVQIIHDVYAKLGISVTVKINNRKILSGIAEVIGEKEKIVDITVAIDKLDKVGVDGVNKELKEKGVSDNAITALQPVISFKGNYSEKVEVLKKLLASSEIGKKGIEEIEFVFGLASTINHQPSTIELDITLARGLNYYTGAIFEVKANNVQIGSICGGGRYDDLTGIFGLPNVSGVGISFGIDRIFDVMNELKLFDAIGLTASTTKVMLAHFGEEERKYCINVASQLRTAGINTEIYPDITKKISKQFDYANKKQIPFVIVIGGDEMKTGELALKDMASGEQEKIKIEEIVKFLSS
jgi:histidyl-tRNA synthetase